MRSIIFALVMTSISTMACAGFVNEGSENPFVESGTQVKVFGNAAQRNFDSVRGMGRDQPLSEAITQIVPKSYSVRTVGIERWYTNAVNWRGGKEWSAVLREVLASTPEILAEIDVDAKVVTLRAKEDMPDAPKVTGGGDAWEVRVDDKTVKSMIERWAKAANWQLYWENSVDYPILASATISGRFEEAVEKIVKSMQGAQVPPRAVFYSNRVLRITSRGVE